MVWRPFYGSKRVQFEESWIRPHLGLFSAVLGYLLPQQDVSMFIFMNQSKSRVIFEPIVMFSSKNNGPATKNNSTLTQQGKSRLPLST